MTQYVGDGAVSRSVWEEEKAVCDSRRLRRSVALNADCDSRRLQQSGYPPGVAFLPPYLSRAPRDRTRVIPIDIFRISRLH